MPNANSSDLPTVFSDFNVRETLPDGCVRIPLGPEPAAPDLQGLEDGQRVLILYPDELRAAGTVQSEIP